MNAPSPTSYRSGERGAFLLAVLILSIVLGGLSLAFLQEGLAERTSVHHHETSLLALEIAEVGLTRSELEILALADPDGDGIGALAAAYGGGLFEVGAAQDASHPDRWVVRSRGEKDLSTRIVELGLRRREAGYFIEGLFSRDDLTLNGSVATDSYDSRVGTWDSQATHVDAGGRYANGRGHVGSNAAIDLKGSKLHIRGNAIPGPLNTVSTSGNPVVWGDTLPRRREIPLPAVPRSEFLDAYLNNDNGQLVPGNAGGNGGGDGGPGGSAASAKKDKSNNGNGNGNDDSGSTDTGSTDTGSTNNGGGNTGYDANTMALNPKGQTQVVLSGGTYFFSSIDLSGGTTIKITGPCRIYVTGGLDLTGGGVFNATGLPENCLIFAHPYAIPPGTTPSTDEIKMAGNSAAMWALYAPERNVKLAGTTDVFGSVVAKQINVVGNANFHYDEALRAVSGGSHVYIERLYWREIELPRR